MLSNTNNIESKLIIVIPLPLYNIGEIGLDYYSNPIKNISLAFFINILLVIFTSCLDSLLGSILGTLNIVIICPILRTSITVYTNIPLGLNISKVWLNLSLISSYLGS